METPSVLKKLGDNTVKYAKGVGSILPGESEYNGIEAIKQNVDQLKDATTSAPKKENKPTTVYPQDRVNKGDKEKYGSRPGEIRLSDEQLQEMTHPLGQVSVPVYDQGGDVDIKDGQHQLAILENGERVLSPDQAQAQDAMVSATDQSSGNMSGKQPRMSPNTPLGKIIQGDKEEAAQKGDLVGLGKAVINEQHLANHPMAQEGNVDTAKLENPFAKATPPKGPLGSALAAPVTESTPGTPTQPAAPMSRHDKLADYDRQIQDSLDKAAATNDPAYQEKADRLKLAKLEYAKSTHLGTAENHPGFLGKLGHVAGAIGNIAGDVFVPGVMEHIPGTQLNTEARRAGLGSVINTDTENQIKMLTAEAGKTPEMRTYAYDVNTLHMTPQDALTDVKSRDQDVKEKEGYIQSREQDYVRDGMDKNAAHQKATEDYYLMKGGSKPPTNELERRALDYIKAHNLENTPANREASRTEIEKSDTATKAEAALPSAEQKIRLQSSLTETNAQLNNVRADALERGKSADEFALKENERHTLREAQIDGANNALDESAQGNELASAIVPIVSTMATSNEQGIKRLNANELARFLPTNGSLYRWAEANVDRFLAGDIPTEYQSELRTMLDNMSKDEDNQHQSNLQSIDNTIRKGGIQPVVNPKGGATSTKKSEPSSVPGPGKAKYHYTSTKGDIFSDDGKTWYTKDGKQVEQKKTGK